MTRGVDDLLADLAEAVDAAAELVNLSKERWDSERPLRLAGEAVIGRLGDIATKLPDEVIKAMHNLCRTRTCCSSRELQIRPDMRGRLETQGILVRPCRRRRVSSLERIDRTFATNGTEVSPVFRTSLVEGRLRR